MEVIIEVLSWLGILAIAYVFGKLVTKIKLPAILGWLITGMIFGPYLVNLVSSNTINETWYIVIERSAECFAGIMIGSEMMLSKLKKYGKSLIVTTLFQSLGTFLIVTICFLITLYLTNGPIYLAFIFGGIALATAPAPAISIVKQYNSRGPVTDTLLPMAALDDLVGIIVFFTVISVVSAVKGGESMPLWETISMVALPILVGAIVGFTGGLIIRKMHKKWAYFLTIILTIALTTISGLMIDIFLFKQFSFNYLMAGMLSSAIVSNFLGEEKLNEFMKFYNPFLNIFLIIVIVNLGMPLDYHAITEAGIYTLIYILSRAIGKYGGAYIGSAITKAPKTVKKYLGLTLLPHSGVSLVFTGIAIKTLSTFDSEAVTILQGCIASAAIINEIIAVILAKEGFKLAGELNNDVVKKIN